MENYKDKMTEGIHVIDNKYTQASLKDVCDYLNQDNVDLISARVVNYNGHYPKMEGNSLEVEVYIHDESKAEAYLARAFKDAVNDCHAQGIHDFDIELIKNSADGVVFSLTIGGHSMRESRSLDIGDIPSNTKKTISSETKLNQAFNDEFDKKIKENAEVLKSYNEYDALKALKAAYEQLPEQLTVADLSDVLHTLNICYHQTVKSTECQEKLWYKDEAFDKAICGIVGAWKHQLTGAEYDAAVKKHPFLTKLFYGSKKDAIFNGDWGHSDEDMTAVSKYLESCTSKRLGENRLLDVGEIPDKNEDYKIAPEIAKINDDTKLNKTIDFDLAKEDMEDKAASAGAHEGFEHEGQAELRARQNDLANYLRDALGAEQTQTLAQGIIDSIIDYERDHLDGFEEEDEIEFDEEQIILTAIKNVVSGQNDLDLVAGTAYEIIHDVDDDEDLDECVIYTNTALRESEGDAEHIPGSQLLEQIPGYNEMAFFDEDSNDTISTRRFEWDYSAKRAIEDGDDLTQQDEFDQLNYDIDNDQVDYKRTDSVLEAIKYGVEQRWDDNQKLTSIKSVENNPGKGFYSVVVTYDVDYDMGNGTETGEMEFSVLTNPDEFYAEDY
jgi:hypothetical protein